MNRKNKVMLIAAIGAVAILIASSAVRCSISQPAPGDQPDQPAASEQGESGAATPEQAEEEAVLGILTGHKWQVKDDSSKTISFKDGTFIESDGKTTKVTAYSVASASEASGASTVDVRLVRDGAESEAPAVISITGSEGTYEVSCDGFQNSKTYVQGSSSEAPVAVTGLAEPYTTLIDGKTDELAQTIAAWCREHVPTATKASFDGEVYVDTKSGRVGATFHCDDKAATVLSVTYEDGAFAVAG